MYMKSLFFMFFFKRIYVLKKSMEGLNKHITAIELEVFLVNLSVNSIQQLFILQPFKSVKATQS